LYSFDYLNIEHFLTSPNSPSFIVNLLAKLA